MLMLKCFTINLVVLIFCHYSYLTNGLHFSLKNKKVRHETKSSGVTVVLYTL